MPVGASAHLAINHLVPKLHLGTPLEAKLCFAGGGVFGLGKIR